MFNEFMFDGPTPCPAIGDFTLEQDGVAGEPPMVVGVERLSNDRLRMRFDRHITPGAWTALTHVGQSISVRVGALPGDVGADGVSNALDAEILIAPLQGKADVGPIWSTNTDRSGAVAPADLLGVINLLVGAGAFDAYDGVALP